MARQLWILLVALMSVWAPSTGTMADTKGPDSKAPLSGQRPVKETVEQINTAGKGPEQKAPLKSTQQSILGTVVKPLEGNRIVIRRRDGGEQPFEVRPAVRNRMLTLVKGKVVVLLVDNDNQVADVAVSP
ncbi:MAG: hypothetical protein QM706_20390 [Nitrospira sp.]